MVFTLRRKNEWNYAKTIFSDEMKQETQDVVVIIENGKNKCS